MPLDLDARRASAPPRLASTVVLLRDRDRATSAAGDDAIEVLVMQRSAASGFLGGAIVFPGGRIDDADARACWPDGIHTGVRGESPAGEWWDDDGITARIAACREALEELGVVPLTGAPIDAKDLATLRAACATKPPTLRAALASLDRALDLAALVPLSRWLTPEAESRRYDTRFFVARAPGGQAATIDAHEAVRTYWAGPRAILREFDQGKVPLFPPTHRTLERLGEFPSVEAAIESARRTPRLEVICPRFVVVEGEAVLALPGDPLHEISEPRIEGASRFVLRDERWIPTNA